MNYDKELKLIKDIAEISGYKKEVATKIAIKHQWI